MEELKVGDTVVATWMTPKRGIRKIRGVVKTLTEQKVLIKYSSQNCTRRSINWSIREVWRHRDNVRKVQPEKGEKDPSQELKNFVEILAGREPTDGTTLPDTEKTRASKKPSPSKALVP